MVSALRSQGAPVRLSVLKGGGHNADRPRPAAGYRLVPEAIPKHLPAAPDPGTRWAWTRRATTLEIISVPDTAWKSQPVSDQDYNSISAAAKALYQKPHSRGEALDSAIWWEIDPASRATTLWLDVPGRSTPPNPRIRLPS